MTAPKVKPADKAKLADYTPTHAELGHVFGVTARTIGDRINSEALAPTGSTLAEHIQTAMLAKISTSDPRLSNGDIAAETLRLKKNQADKIEIFNARARGELVLASEVEKAIGIAFAELRAALLSLPTDVGPEIASLDDKTECVELLRTRIYAALTSVAEGNIGKTVDQALKGSRPTDEDDVSAE